ncbi:hypothetical protein AQ490_25550 [Wenjunlia vitaminophila]|uniref:Uncharacterized protein n=1 Tax=Wenjunlia vitaminophila TaxID=76728 RepID=A0A0T6LR18_WENVI|nr:hypothetical protein AQ490_25550 [Wenjunlia vitaminophila]
MLPYVHSVLSPAKSASFLKPAGERRLARVPQLLHGGPRLQADAPARIRAVFPVWGNPVGLGVEATVYAQLLTPRGGLLVHRAAAGLACCWFAERCKWAL